MALTLPFGKLRVGCLGKIPAYAEYLSIPVGGGAEKAFRAWTDTCASVLNETRGAPCGTAYRFLQHVPDEDAVVVGWLWDSADRMKRRRPLGVYTVCSRRAFQGRLRGVPFVADRLWQALFEMAFAGGDVWVRTRTATPEEGLVLKQAIEERLGKARCERPAPQGADDDALAQLAARPAKEWLAEVLGRENAVASFAHVLWQFGNAFAAAPDIFEWPAMRLPFGAGPSAVLQAAFWLGVMEQLRFTPAVLPPSLVIPDDNAQSGDPALVVAFRPLRGGDATVLFGLKSSLADLYDVRLPRGLSAVQPGVPRAFTDAIHAHAATCASAADLLSVRYCEIIAESSEMPEGRSLDDETKALPGA